MAGTVKPLKLTPARIRGLHSKLDELIRINHSISLRPIVGTIESAFDLVRPKSPRHRRSRPA
jgi:hypothetical protein